MNDAEKSAPALTVKWVAVKEFMESNSHRPHPKTFVTTNEFMELQKRVEELSDRISDYEKKVNNL